MRTILFLVLSGCAHVAAPSYEIRGQAFGSCVTSAPRDSPVQVGDLIVGPGDPADEDVRASWGRALRTRDAEPFRVDVVRAEVQQTYEARRRRAARIEASFEQKRDCEEQSRQLAAQWRVQERALAPEREAEAVRLLREEALLVTESEASTARVQTAFIEQSAGPELFARRAGINPEDPVVIVVNDGPGQSHDALVAMDVLAERGWTVVVFDQRGVGLSSSPAEPADYSFAVQAADIEAVRQWAGGEQVVLLGHAWGSTLAVDYATRYPDTLLGVVLVGADAIVHSGVGKRDSDLIRTHSLAEIERFKRQIDPSCQPWSRRIGHDYARMSTLKPEHVAGTCSVDVRDWVRDAVGEFDLTAAMAQITVPVLVWYGDGDAYHINQPSIVDALTAAPVTVHTEPACGHRPMFQCTERFYDSIVPFLDGLRTQPD